MGNEKSRERKERGRTMDETSGSSGFGFSIRSYIAIITYLVSGSLPDSSDSLASSKKVDIPWFIFELGFH